MEPPLKPKLAISTPPTSEATGQNSQFLGVLYLALTGLIDSALPAARPWAVAGKALSYLAMPVPASTPPSPTRAPQYSWYPDTKSQDYCPSHQSALNSSLQQQTSTHIKVQEDNDSNLSRSPFSLAGCSMQQAYKT
ncbi:hypothetical protein DSO57_1018132 [Entomophthora muscae]|uniref:Uncharacterized protein n=1 Tax=Entomophthora muscae TaxID=34485 RepID=A0ACC2T4H4_9FUNG|nr:hypothetical protein DSO57_1018132 [Entomophthora muscae]